MLLIADARSVELRDENSSSAHQMFRRSCQRGCRFRATENRMSHLNSRGKKEQQDQMMRRARTHTHTYTHKHRVEDRAFKGW